MTTQGPIEQEHIQLVLSVDKAELEKQLGDIFGQAGAPGSGARGAGLSGGGVEGVKPVSGETGGKGIPVQPGAGFMKAFKPLLALAGISMSLSFLVKSSKLMQGALGALHSVIGAMVDSFLAPFMPVIAAGISWLAEHGIPFMQDKGQDIFNAIQTLGDVFSGNSVDQLAALNKIADFLGNPKNVVDWLLGPDFVENVGNGIRSILGDYAPKLGIPGVQNPNLRDIFNFGPLNAGDFLFGEGVARKTDKTQAIHDRVTSREGKAAISDMAREILRGGAGDALAAYRDPDSSITERVAIIRAFREAGISMGSVDSGVGDIIINNTYNMPMSVLPASDAEVAEAIAAKAKREVEMAQRKLNQATSQYSRQ